MRDSIYETIPSDFTPDPLQSMWAEMAVQHFKREAEKDEIARAIQRYGVFKVREHLGSPLDALVNPTHTV